jgi:hypothetical protein
MTGNKLIFYINYPIQNNGADHVVDQQRKCGFCGRAEVFAMNRAHHVSVAADEFEHFFDAVEEALAASENDLHCAVFLVFFEQHLRRVNSYIKYASWCALKKRICIC